MTAQRYLDLHDVGGADDYFSSDLADDEMRKRFSAFGARGVGCLVAYSGADEYAPESVDTPRLVEKICGACAAGDTARVAGLVVAGAPVGSTAPKAAAARPLALRNAMLTEQLYFCDSLRAIL